MAYEFVEDCVRQDIIYCEYRYAPQFLVSDNIRKWAGLDEPASTNDKTPNGSGISIREVVQSVCDGLADGMAKYPSVKVTGILCGIRGFGGKVEGNFLAIAIFFPSANSSRYLFLQLSGLWGALWANSGESSAQ